MYYKYDLKNGIIYDWVKLLIPIVIAIIACISFNSELKDAVEFEFIDRKAEFTDVLMYIFKGEKPFDPNNNEDFKFPFTWLINQLVIAFIIGKYPLFELYNNHGAFVLLKGGSRKKWIISKFLWIITACVIYYALIILTVAIFCVLSGVPFSFELKPSESFALLTSTETVGGFELLKIFTLPILTSIALSSIQISISLVSQSVYGFAFVLGFCGASIFTNSILTFGNCSILIRNELFNYSNINTGKSLILLGIIIVMSFIFSLIYFERCDIMRNRSEE